MRLDYRFDLCERIRGDMGQKKKIDFKESIFFTMYSRKGLAIKWLQPAVHLCFLQYSCIMAVQALLE